MPNQEGESATHRLQEKQLAANIEELESRTENLQEQLNKYMSGMPVVSMPLRDVAQYFPVLIAAAAGIFLWRFSLLRKRAATLSKLYARRGASEQILDLKFPEAKRNITMEWAAFGSAVVLIGVSAKQALDNKDLADGFPWVFLGIALFLCSIIFMMSWHAQPADSPVGSVDAQDAVLR